MECRRGSRASGQTRTGSCPDQGEANTTTRSANAQANASSGNGQTPPGTRTSTT